MIQFSELRLGNYVLYKQDNRIQKVKFGFEHFALVAQEGGKNFYPVVLSTKEFENCGFEENEDYPLRPAAKEYMLVLPVPGTQKNEIRGYLKNNQECFGRTMLNGLPSSVNFFHLHQLQNIYFALVGQELSYRAR